MICLVLAGRARIRQDGATHLLGPGVALRAPAGVEHGLACEGEETLEVLVARGPPGHVDLSCFGSCRRALAVRGAAPASRDGTPDAGDAARIRG